MSEPDRFDPDRDVPPATAPPLVLVYRVTVRNRGRVWFDYWSCAEHFDGADEGDIVREMHTSPEEVLRLCSECSPIEV